MILKAIHQSILLQVTVTRHSSPFSTVIYSKLGETLGTILPFLHARYSCHLLVHMELNWCTLITDLAQMVTPGLSQNDPT